MGSNTSEVLRELADMFEERGLIRGESFTRMGPIMSAFFPNGLGMHTENEFLILDLFIWVVGKLNRFAQSKFTDEDSIRDASCYCAMIAAVISNINDKDDGT